jgi:fatty-acyl-CoA synthase
MVKPHLMDKLIEGEYPSLATDADVRAIERVPFEERVAARNTYDALCQSAAAAPDRPAIHFLQNADPDETPFTVTYRDLLSRVTQTANLLHSLGVGSGDVVSFLLPLLPESFYVLLGAQATGIVNPVNPLLEPGQIADILNAVKSKVLVALGPVPGSDIWDKVSRIREALPHLETVLQVAGTVEGRNGVLAFSAELAKHPQDRLVSGRRIRANETAAYFHTGGTTGMPKLVRHTHLNHLYQAWAVNLIFRNGSDSTLLMGLPLFHVGGALSQTLVTLGGAGTLVVPSPAGWRNPAALRNLWRLLARYRATTISAVPTVLAAAIAAPPAGLDLSAVRYTSGGGSAIPVQVGKAYQELLGVPVIEVYGMTETSSIHTLSFPDRPVRLGSVGHALPYSRVRVVKLGADGRSQRDCAPNEIGVVLMKGPGVTSGYLNEKHNRALFLDDGWVNSGDLGRLDEEGYLWITGREKDLVIRGGHNIDPLPIEEILYQHPAVGLAAVVGQPDAYAGELPVAYVQLKPGASAQSAELLDFVRQRTPERAAVPVDLIPVSTMPLTGVGKVFKPELRWDAARRVFSAALRPLAKDGAAVEVKVGAHAVHGSLATVVLKGVAASRRAALEQQVRERLSAFTMRHEIEWG